MAKKASKRAKKYDKPILFKEGVKWDDLVNLSITTPPQEAPTNKASNKKKK